jgi:hypothetical protein
MPIPSWNSKRISGTGAVEHVRGGVVLAGVPVLHDPREDLGERERRSSPPVAPEISSSSRNTPAEAAEDLHLRVAGRLEIRAS